MENKETTPAAVSKRPVAAVLVAAAIFIVLLTPCLLASSSNAIFPRTSVAGIDLSGLSEQAASEVLAENLPAVCQDSALEVQIDRSSADLEDTVLQIPVKDLIAAPKPSDAASLAEKAFQHGRTGNFFTQGVAYGRSLLTGTEISPDFQINQDGIKAILEKSKAEASIPVQECTWQLENEQLRITRPKSGYLLDTDALSAELETAVLSFDLTPIRGTLIETAPAPITMEELYQDAHAEPSTAYYDRESGTIRDGATGIDFDPAEAQKLYDDAADGEVFTVPVVVTYPEITREEMEKVLFRDRLGECTTNVGGSAGRKHNVSLAVRACNGLVLNPGEVFSYNQTLGPRTPEKGYRSAPAYSSGKSIMSYGGGICQVSSTIYLAALRSNLEVVTRYNHSFWPGYIPLGMDATVSWGGPDLKLKNNTDYPIRFDVSYKNGKAHCEIHGTNVTGQSVKMEYALLSSSPFEVIEKEDPSLPAGTKKQEQSGYTGYKVDTYRCVYDANGKLISRTNEARSIYNRRDKIILVGPAVSEMPEEPTVPINPSEPSEPVSPTEPEKPEIPSPEMPLPSVPEQPAAPEGDPAVLT